MALSSTELRGLVNALEELYLPVGSDEYPDRVITVVSTLISVGSCSYNHLDGSTALAYEIQPVDVGQAASIAAMLSQPVPENFDHSGDGPLLTPRQMRILQLVADGRADREVGRMLGISTRTVHAHLQRIYRALNVTSRTEALAQLRQRSLTASAQRARNSGS
jgi:DNA-binding NarL/FixJ family response regulator